MEEQNGAKHSTHIRAITMRAEQVFVTIKSLRILDTYGFLTNIFSVLAQHKISIDLITISEISVALTVDINNVGSHLYNAFIEGSALLDNLRKFAEVTVESDLTLLAVVGQGLAVPGTVQAIMSIIETDKVHMICYGASSSSISILVPRDTAPRIANTLHKHLLEKLQA
jgi:aspartate kinase